MNAAQVQQLLNEDRALTMGQPIVVRWGYGLGFRAHGRGRIVALYPKSLRVELLEDVPTPSGTGIGWRQGFVLKGIPRFGGFNPTWNTWNCVMPVPEPAAVGGIADAARTIPVEDNQE